MTKNRDPDRSILAAVSWCKDGLSNYDTLKYWTQKHIEKARYHLYRIANIHHMHLSELDVIGTWSLMESSFICDGKQDINQVLGPLAEYAKLHDQDSIVALIPLDVPRQSPSNGFRLPLQLIETIPHSEISGFFCQYYEYWARRNSNAPPASFVPNLEGHITRIEHWGKQQHWENATKIQIAVQSVLGNPHCFDLEESKPNLDYEFIEIQAKDYDLHIERSIPGRAKKIVRGSLLKIYR